MGVGDAGKTIREAAETYVDWNKKISTQAKGTPKSWDLSGVTIQSGHSKPMAGAVERKEHDYFDELKPEEQKKIVESSKTLIEFFKAHPKEDYARIFQGLGLERDKALLITKTRVEGTYEVVKDIWSKTEQQMHRKK